MSASLPERSVRIDEDGYFQFGELRVTDESVGRELFENLHFDEDLTLLSVTGETPVGVEAFNSPLVPHQIELVDENTGRLFLPYGHSVLFSLETLRLDEWDRLHGVAQNGLPFICSRTAQAELFQLADEFEDEAICLKNRWIQTPNVYQNAQSVNETLFWSALYKENEIPPWDKQAVAPGLAAFVPKLKLQRSRVLVLGCGRGDDAAFFAERGHIVTAVDFSSEAITSAKSRFKNVRDLKFEQRDLFSLPKEWQQQFDLVVEHQCFAAISPQRRADLVKVWQQMLQPSGAILGVFYVMPKFSGPPFGSSEWELRQRLQKRYDFLYWNRLKPSESAHPYRELLIFAQKKSNS